MEHISIEDAVRPGGGGFGFIEYLRSGFGDEWLAKQVLAGNVDYAGLAASQGTYYNTVGA